VVNVEEKKEERRRKKRKGIRKNPN
jgi:hypothetical protein